MVIKLYLKFDVDKCIFIFGIFAVIEGLIDDIFLLQGLSTALASASCVILLERGVRQRG